MEEEESTLFGLSFAFSIRRISSGDVDAALVVAMKPLSMLFVRRRELETPLLMVSLTGFVEITGAVVLEDTVGGCCFCCCWGA